MLQGPLLVIFVTELGESNAEFISVPDGIYALGKAHMRSIPSL